MIINELKKLKNVIKVENIEITNTKFVDVKEQYFVYFKQPLDWNDESKGTFIQRVRVGFNDWDNFNTIYIGGYADNNWQNLPHTKRKNYEIQRKYNTNIIQIEYRNYGKSVLNKDKYSMKYCQYLTFENAIKDFKFILDQFKTIWKNKWIASGWSKGGMTTCQLAAFFPNCCDLFVPYVATAKIEKEDYNLLKYVYTKIGKTCLDKNNNPINLEQYRKTVTLFQIYLLENRDYFSKAWIEYAKNKEYQFTDFAKDNFELVYNSMVVDFCYLYYWQYREKDENFDRLNKFLTIKDPKKQIKTVEKYWIGTDQISDWVLNAGCSNAYWFQNYIAHGYYSFNPTPLVNCILKYSNKYISKDIWQKLLNHPKKYILESNKDFLYKNNLTPEQYEQGKFNQKNIDILFPWYANCDSNVIFISGIEDPWYQVSINPKNKLKHSDKIIEYNLKGLSHMARIAFAPKETQKQIWAKIDEILK